jgi:hypothetical protein
VWRAMEGSTWMKGCGCWLCCVLSGDFHALLSFVCMIIVLWCVSIHLFIIPQSPCTL